MAGGRRGGSHWLIDMRKRDKLRPRSAAVLEFVRTEVAAGMGIPQPGRIGQYMGWKGSQSGRDALIRLAAAGYLRMEVVTLSGGRWNYAFSLPDDSV